MTQHLRLVVNRPGLSAIAYRIGTHGRFKRNLLDRIAGEPALRGLTTRSGDDFAIAMLDAWASAADVLTFYQERLANESYLRTASERESLGHLARLLGYELGPGVSAGAALAFTVDPVTSRGEPVVLDVGVKVQSIPGPGEPPQTFEIAESIEARVAYNELRAARVGAPLALAPAAAAAEFFIHSRRNDFVVDIGNNDRSDGAFLVCFPRKRVGDDNQRWRLVDAGGGFFFIESVLSGHVITIREGDFPQLVVSRRRSPNDGAQLWAFDPVGDVDFVLRNRDGRVFDIRGDDPRPSALLQVFRAKAAAEGRDNQLWRFALAPEARPQRLLIRGAVQVGDALLAVRADNPAAWRVATVDVATPRPEFGGTEVVLGRFQGPNPSPAASGPERLSVLRQRAALFGNNAPDPLTLSNQLPTALFADKNAANGWAGFGLSEGVVELDAVYSGLSPGDRVLLRGPSAARLVTITAVETVTLARYALSARVTRLQVAIPGEGDPLLRFGRRTAEVCFAGEPVSLLAEPRTDPVEGAVLDLATPVPDLLPGRALLVSGPLADGSGSATELVTIASLVPGGATLTLASALQHRYRRDGVIVRANVARATHGETVSEVLGGGDASQPLQRFILQQTPLTFVSARNARGRVSSLQIVVDGERWREVDTFEGTGPGDHVYVVQLGEGGAAAVQFGDGVRGARLPSGTANVRATYRKGTGLAGLVRAGQLSLLSAPPRGILGVQNPLPAVGAAAPEDLASARRNAPLQVRTIGRVVSVPDYEDFARAFTGVAKAHAVAFRDGDREGVLVTVAGFGDTAIPPGSDTHDNLLAALRESGAPGVIVRLQSYTSARFTISGRVRVAPERELPELRAALRAALLDRFGFDARDFARPVYPSEIVAAIQAVPGVLAVDLKAPAAPLPAFSAVRPATPAEPRLTELLTIDLTDPKDPKNPLALASLEVTR